MTTGDPLDQQHGEACWKGNLLFDLRDMCFRWITHGKMSFWELLKLAADVWANEKATGTLKLSTPRRLDRPHSVINKDYRKLMLLQLVTKCSCLLGFIVAFDDGWVRQLYAELSLQVPRHPVFKERPGCKTYIKDYRNRNYHLVYGVSLFVTVYAVRFRHRPAGTPAHDGDNKNAIIQQ